MKADELWKAAMSQIYKICKVLNFPKMKQATIKRVWVKEWHILYYIWKLNTQHPSPNTHRLTPVICIASPLICYALDYLCTTYFSYHFGYELLMINGALTYLGLRVIKA